MKSASVIDSVLDTEKRNEIQSLTGDYLIATTFVENKGGPGDNVSAYVTQKISDLGEWQDHWDHTLSMFSFVNGLPPGIDRESGDAGNGGYHRDFGGFVYYIHPTWESSWGGNLKLKDCDTDKIAPIPNRFVWVNPSVCHGMQVVDKVASNTIITVVAWPTGTMEYSSADLIINTLVQIQG